MDRYVFFLGLPRGLRREGTWSMLSVETCTFPNPRPFLEMSGRANGIWRGVYMTSWYRGMSVLVEIRGYEVLFLSIP